MGLALLIFISGISCVQAQEGRIVNNFDFNWHFINRDVPEASAADYRAENWRLLDLPHDWSIEGTYAKDNPGGGQMGYLPGGIGWYRKDLPWDKAWTGKEVQLEFDGVFMNSEVWINGHLLGKRPNGFISFGYNLTPYLKKGKNSIAVRVDNSKQPSARWYTGSGIYRHVHLVITDKIHVARHGTFIQTPVVTEDQASVMALTTIQHAGAKGKTVDLLSRIIDAQGVEVAQEKESVILKGDTTTIRQDFELKNPELWSPETPHVYYLHTTVLSGKKVLDTYKTRFGVRSIAYGADFGFKLNGKVIKFKGVCIHQDAGPAGVAVPEDMWYRRLKLLKEMGCNAIRTTHHPFPPEFYALCDTLGFLVMDEAFDGWEHWENFGKAKWDYGIYFKDWWRTDLEEFIKRDRNHPSVVMWSLGNEVWGYQQHLDLQEAINGLYHTLDPTRPTTQAWALDKYLDIAGFNANGEGRFDLAKFHREQPKKAAIGTEIPHTRQTRGVYRTRTSYHSWDKADAWETGPNREKELANLYPIANLSEEEVFTNYKPQYASGYDNQTRKISVRDEWKQVRDNAFYMGDFRWTGFDYLGEAWGWPSRTNNYGIIDMAGFPKDHYYLYQSFWSDKPMVHLLPHWTHPGLEGKNIPVVVYTNGDAAELFLNGKSLGRKKMDRDTLQIVWQVPYQPGTLEAVAYQDGKEIARKSTVTAGETRQIALQADKQVIRANKRDVVHVEVNLLDAKGNFNPTAQDTIQFSVDGPYKLIGVENGDILDVNPQKVLWRQAFMGKALLVLQATDKTGALHIKAQAKGLQPGELMINVNGNAHE